MFNSYKDKRADDKHVFFTFNDFAITKVDMPNVHLLHPPLYDPHDKTGNAKLWFAKPSDRAMERCHWDPVQNVPHPTKPKSCKSGFAICGPGFGLGDRPNGA